MGQISVKTYAANGSLLNDNQQNWRLLRFLDEMNEFFSANLRRMLDNLLQLIWG